MNFSAFIFEMKKSNVLLNKSQIRCIIRYITIIFISFSVCIILFFYKNNNIINKNGDIMNSLFVPMKLKSISFQINQKDSLTSEIC